MAEHRKKKNLTVLEGGKQKKKNGRRNKKAPVPNKKKKGNKEKPDYSWKNSILEDGANWDDEAWDSAGMLSGSGPSSAGSSAYGSRAAGQGLKDDAQTEGGVLKWVIVGVLIALLLTACGGLYYVWHHYGVTTIYVEGNVHYTSDEIIDMVMTGPLDNNSLYLSFRYRDKSIEDIPFIQKMDVSVVSPTTIRITVYEKALAGYVEYLGRYMYFDKDGIIVESSEAKTAGIPMVSGLKFDHVVLHERLPVENEQIFEGILDITQMLTKYGLQADRIYFDDAYEMTLYFGNVRVKIGGTDMIDEKIMKLQYILPGLEGKSGVLRMENYTTDSRIIAFEEDETGGI